MFDRCVNCGGKIMLQGRRDEHGAFCSWQCQNYFRHPNFCPHCLAETTDEDCGGTSTVNAVGTKLFGYRQQCPECGSVVQTKCFCVFFPLIPLGTYRVLYATPTRFFSRKLLRQIPRGAPDASPFTSPAPTRAASSFALPEAGAAPSAGVFRCPHCGSPSPAIGRRRISAAGWIVFAILLLFCFPLCWAGLLIQEEHWECPQCRRRVA